MRLMRALIAWHLALCTPASADGIEVDLELVLMVDVSRSMTTRELEIQRRGYAEALDSDVVFAAMQSGLLQRIALTYVEWAGTQDVIVDWQLLETRSDLADFAAALSNRFDPTLRRTSISEALMFGAETLESNPYDGLRRVIDVSGDGPNNQGRPVTDARDALIAQGIVINGLPLMTREGMGSQWHLEDLDIYYETCVIGGPGAFVLPVLDWADFTDAVRRKLVLEMVALPPPRVLQPAQYDARDPSDCLVGEKMWRDRRGNWISP